MPRQGKNKQNTKKVTLEKAVNKALAKAQAKKGKTQKQRTPRKQRGSKAGAKVDTAPKNTIRTLTNPDGSVTKFTTYQLNQIRLIGKGPPEGFIGLAHPQNVIFTNVLAQGGVRNQWEAIAEAEIAARTAASPLLVIPRAGPAHVKHYLCHFMFSRLRMLDAIRPGPTGTPAQFSTNSVPEFNEKEFNIPVGFAKFVQYLGPYVHPCGTRFQYVSNWDSWFDGTPTVNWPQLQGPSIYTGANVADIFNRSYFNNSNLTMKDTPLTGEENLWGIDPNAIGAQTLAQVIDTYADISQWLASTGSVVPASKIPMKAPDGTFYSFVNSAETALIPNQSYPAIYANHQFFDHELSYIFHQATLAADNLMQVQQTFNFKREIPSVLFQSIPTNVPQFPAQSAMIINYSYITRQCCWVGGGKSMLLKSAHRIWPMLNSFEPNYWDVDLNAFHQMKEESLDLISINAGAGASITTNTLPCADTVIECALLASVLKYSYPSFFYYSNSDIASSTAVSNNFTSIKLPPLIADFITGLAPVVVDGQLKIPLLGFKPANYGTAALLIYYGLLATTDQNTARWLFRLNPDDAVAYPGGLPNFEMYTPTLTYAPTVTTAPTTLDRRYPFGSGLFSAAPTAVTLAAGFNVTRANMLGAGILSPVVPVAASRYAGQTPIRYSHDFLDQYITFVRESDSTLVSAELCDLGLFCCLNPVKIKLIQAQPANQIATTSSNFFQQLNFRPENIGSIYPLDQGSVGRTGTFCYRTATDVKQLPYSMAIASATNPLTSILTMSLRTNGGTNSFVAEMIARSGKGLNQIQVVRAIFEGEFRKIGGNTSVEYLHGGDAVLLIKKMTARIACSPYHNSQSLSVGSFNSPSLLNVAETGGRGFASSGSARVPFLSPVSDFLGDLFGLLIK